MLLLILFNFTAVFQTAHESIMNAKNGAGSITGYFFNAFRGIMGWDGGRELKRVFESYCCR